MKPQNALLEIDSANRASHTCFIANVRSLLGSIRMRHRIVEAIKLAGRAGPDADEDLPSPTMHDFHVGELEASLLADGTDAPAFEAIEYRYDDLRELSRARLIFVLTWLNPLLLVSATLVIFSATMGHALSSLLQFSMLAMAIPLIGSLAARLLRGFQRRHKSHH